MKRPLALTLVAVLAVVAVVALQRRPEPMRAAPPGERNPAGFVASDVARLAATGRPQLVEIFHYG